MGHIFVGRRTLLAKTCLMCGIFKMAKQFTRMKGGHYDSYCKPCHNLHSRPTMRGHQEKTLTAAVRHRQPWSEQDIEKLVAMIEEGRTGPVMALALNRSVYSVYTMKNKLSKENA